MVGTTFIARKNEFEVFTELILVEETCDSFELLVSMWPSIDLVIAPPSTNAVEPRPNRSATEMTTIDFFNYVTKRPKKIRGDALPFSALLVEG